MEPSDFSLRLASQNERDLVRATRQDAYRELLAKAGPGAAVTDDFDGSDHCPSFLLVDGEGDVAGTIRPCVRSHHFGWPALPLSRSVPRELLDLLDNPVPLIQSTFLGVTPEFRHLGTFPSLALLRALCEVARSFGIVRMVTVIDARPTKIRFWGRAGWSKMGDPFPHPFAPGGAIWLSAQVEEILERVRSGPFLSAFHSFPATVPDSGSFPGILRI